MNILATLISRENLSPIRNEFFLQMGVKKILKLYFVTRDVWTI